MLFLVFGAAVTLFTILSSSLPSPTIQSYESTKQLTTDDSLRIRRSLYSNDASGSHGSKLRRLEQPTDMASLVAAYPDLTPPLPPNPSTSYRFIFLSYTAFYPAYGYTTPTNNASMALDPFYGNIASQASQYYQQNWPTKAALAFGSGRVFMNYYSPTHRDLLWKQIETFALRVQQYAKRGMVGKWEMVMWPPNGQPAVVANLLVFG